MATTKPEIKIPRSHELKFRALHPDAKLPVYATQGAAAMDLHAVLPNSGCVSVTENSPQVIPTGLAVEVPAGHVMLVFSRSGHGFKSDVRLANCVGVIDSDYRGELMVKLTRDNARGDAVTVYHGDRIAQAMVIPVRQYQPVMVDTLSETERGEGGLGSTGA
jgi:dUTP pyrophosphatase